MSAVSSLISRRFSSRGDDVAFEISLKALTGCMTGAGVLVVALHWLVHALNDRELLASSKSSINSIKHSNNSNRSKSSSSANGTDSIRGVIKPKKQQQQQMKQRQRQRPSLVESLRVLSSSRYLRNVATMVVSYGLTMEFTEIMWKAAVKKAFPIKTDYLRFMGRYSTYVGTAAFVMMFVGSNIVTYLGWRAGALLTPLVMAALAAPFFGCIISGGVSSGAPARALLLAVYVGLVQNVLSKATKYAVFDPTKVKKL